MSFTWHTGASQTTQNRLEAGPHKLVPINCPQLHSIVHSTTVHSMDHATPTVSAFTWWTPRILRARQGTCYVLAHVQYRHTFQFTECGFAYRAVSQYAVGHTRSERSVRAPSRLMNSQKHFSGGRGGTRTRSDFNSHQIVWIHISIHTKIQRFGVNC